MLGALLPCASCADNPLITATIWAVCCCCSASCWRNNLSRLLTSVGAVVVGSVGVVEAFPAASGAAEGGRGPAGVGCGGDDCGGAPNGSPDAATVAVGSAIFSMEGWFG